jgi:hypothetical protein
MSDAIFNGGWLPIKGWYLWRETKATNQWIVFYNSIPKRGMRKGWEWRGPFDTGLDAKAAAPGPASVFSIRDREGNQ